MQTLALGHKISAVGQILLYAQGQFLKTTVLTKTRNQSIPLTLTLHALNHKIQLFDYTCERKTRKNHHQNKIRTVVSYGEEHGTTDDANCDQEPLGLRAS